MKTPVKSERFSNFRSISIPLFLKEHVKKKSSNFSKYIKDLLQEYYQTIATNSLNEDTETVIFSVRMTQEQQIQIVNAVNCSPHVSVSDLIRTMLWMDFLKDKNRTRELIKFQETYPDKNIVRVPLADGYIEYKIIGEA